MATLRISDLPRVTGVTTDDYLMINSGNTITSIISTYNFADYVIGVIETEGLYPNQDIDGGDIVAPILDVVDGGTPSTFSPTPVLNGGSPTDPGYGPSVDGEYP